MLQPTLQDQLFEIILSRFPRRADAVDELCELLSLAKDPIYRRLRGDTFLSPQELAKLAVHYRISLDALRSEEGRVGKECRLTCRSRWSPYH